MIGRRRSMDGCTRDEQTDSIRGTVGEDVRGLFDGCTHRLALVHQTCGKIGSTEQQKSSNKEYAQW